MSGKNNNDNHQQAQADQATAGYVLSKQREALGLSTEKCAQDLKISEYKLKALESGDYSAFASDLFVRGYLKNYAKLVSLSESEVLDSYQAHLPELQSEEVVALSSGAPKKRWWLPYVVGVLIILLWAALYPIMSSNSDSTSVDDVLSIDGVVVAEPATQSESALPLPIEVENIPAVDDSLVADVGESSSGIDDPLAQASAESQGAVPIVVSNVTAAELIKSLTPEAEEPPVEEVVPADDTLFFSFSEDCWIQVTDSGGQVVVSGLQRGSTQLKLVGKAPFNVVLGNAHGAKLALNDNPVALANQRILRLTVGG